jgi:hypothetical protein
MASYKPPRGAVAVLAVFVSLLALAASYIHPLQGPLAPFATGAGRRACPLAVGVRIKAARRSLGLRMVDIRPRVDINPEDFAPSRQGSADSEMYALDDGGSEPTAYGDEEVVSSDEERDPGDLRNFPISDQSLDSLARKGITKLFPVQIATFMEIYNGRDVLARARTGTGKTLAFALPILERLIVDKIETGSQRRSRGTKPSCIILSPTRELANQVEKEIEVLTEGGAVKVSTLCVYGGTPYAKQERDLRNGVDMVVGTPGRLIDLYEKGTLDLSEVKYLVSQPHSLTLADSHADCLLLWWAVLSLLSLSLSLSLSPSSQNVE